LITAPGWRSKGPIWTSGSAQGGQTMCPESAVCSARKTRRGTGRRGLNVYPAQGDGVSGKAGKQIFDFPFSAAEFGPASGQAEKKLTEGVSGEIDVGRGRTVQARRRDPGVSAPGEQAFLLQLASLRWRGVGGSGPGRGPWPCRGMGGLVSPEAFSLLLFQVSGRAAPRGHLELNRENSSGLARLLPHNPRFLRALDEIWCDHQEGPVLPLRE